ncbi:MAG TPA: PAS domain S-box protein, partial [Bacteroidia bacterium]|nr:PAS domain S-box protein [Bacteroidia bacterium]
MKKEQPQTSVSDLEEEIEKLRGQLATQIKLNETNMGLEKVLNAVSAAVYHIDLRKEEGERITFVSSSLEQIFGMPKEKFLTDKKAFIPYYHPEDLERIRATSAELEKEKAPKTYYYRYRHPKNNEYIWVEETVTPSVDDKGNLVEIFGVARNVTERKQYEEKLLESRESYKALVDQSPDGIIVAGFDQRIIFANNAVLEISGIKSL